MKDLERRVAVTQPIELRQAEGESPGGIRGYAALYDTLSVNLGGFRERIEPGAFEGRLNDDVRALVNHDPSLILGRTRSGTLSLSLDNRGLIYEVDPLPDTRTAHDLAESVGRGDIDQSSFAFTVEEDEWDEDDEGRIIRTIKKFRQLYDVSPVTYPAYEDTTIGTRSLQALAEFQKRHEHIAASADHRRRVLDLISLGQPSLPVDLRD